MNARRNPVPGKRIDQMNEEEREAFYAYLNGEPDYTEHYVEGM